MPGIHRRLCGLEERVRFKRKNSLPRGGVATRSHSGRGRARIGRRARLMTWMGLVEVIEVRLPITCATPIIQPRLMQHVTSTCGRHSRVWSFSLSTCLASTREKTTLSNLNVTSNIKIQYIKIHTCYTSSQDIKIHTCSIISS